MSRWSTFVSIEVEEIVRISELLHSGRGGWCHDQMSQFFGSDLASRVLFIAILTYTIQDVRVWGSSCKQRMRAKDLYAMYYQILVRRLDAAWIWRIGVHQRVSLFLWKVAWGCLPTRLVLSRDENG